MVINTTRWSPDTCTCVIDYTWDSTQSESTRVHNLGTIVNKCPAHSSLSDSTVYSTVLEENPRKNQALQNILDNSPTTALFDTLANGNRVLKPALGFNFTFSGTAPNRVLTVSFIGITLTTNQKNTLQSALNTRFGSGKVLIA